MVFGARSKDYFALEALDMIYVFLHHVMDMHSIVSKNYYSKHLYVVWNKPLVE